MELNPSLLTWLWSEFPVPSPSIELFLLQYPLSKSDMKSFFFLFESLSSFTLVLRTTVVAMEEHTQVFGLLL